MRHIVEIKFPKLFGRKKKVVEVDESTEGNIEEAIIGTTKMIEETSTQVSETMRLVAPLALALAVGYVAGYNRGLMKGLIRDASERIIVVNK